MSSAPDTNLMHLFRFTAADLEANRVGYMSQDQVSWLKEEIESQTQQIGCFFVLAVLTILLIFYPWISSLNNDKSLQQFVGMLGVVILGGLLIVGYIWRKNRIAVVTDSQLQQVDAITGIMLLKQEHRPKSGFIHSLTVEFKTFRLTDAQYNYLKSLSEMHGGETRTSHPLRILDSYYVTTITCSVFYANKSETILSMEIGA